MKEEILREKLREILEKDSGYVPGMPGKSLRKSERISLLNTFFPVKKFPKKIKKWQIQKTIKSLQSRKFKIKDKEKREDLERKVRYLKKITGL